MWTFYKNSPLTFVKRAHKTNGNLDLLQFPFRWCLKHLSSSHANMPCIYPPNARGGLVSLC